MVDEYLSDREQEEALRNWWRENWKWIVAGVALGLGLLGGWKYLDTYRLRQAQAAAQVYADFEAARSKGDAEQAQRLANDLVSDHGSSAYAQQARLMLAKDHAAAGKVDEAVALLRALIDDTSDDELAQVARMRTARLLIQQAKHDEALQLLNTEEAGAFAAPIHEIRGDALLAKGDTAAARSEYAAALAAEPGVPVDRTLLELKLGEVADASPAPSDTADAPPATEGAPTTGQP